MVFSPILDNFEISERLDIPLTSETKISGTAINFKRLIKIVPQGLIQSIVNFSNPRVTASIPHIIPITIPINIFQIRGSFFHMTQQELRNKEPKMVKKNENN